MDLSFYSAALGARAQQNRLDSIANNIANVNNAGYNAVNTSFANLLYQNVRYGTDSQTGVGAYVERTNIDFASGGFQVTDGEYDYAIDGSGFFAVQNLASGETLYTRSGSFIASVGADGLLYLGTVTGERVLDAAGNHIRLTGEQDQPLNIGIFAFNHTENFEAVGNNLYRPTEANGNPFVNNEATLVKGSLENSNVNLTGQLSTMIETQRIFQLALRMVSTADELETVINNLR